MPRQRHEPLRENGNRVPTTVTTTTIIIITTITTTTTIIIIIIAIVLVKGVVEIQRTLKAVHRTSLRSILARRTSMTSQPLLPQHLPRRSEP